MRWVSVLFVLSVLSVISHADVFNLGPGLTSLETVVVGDPGNAPDTRYHTPGYGAVDYTYRMGKYEVTAAQYCDFLNHKAKSDSHGLYSSSMSTTSGCKIIRSGTSGNYTYSVAADWADRPVNYVYVGDACRFANWLHNGQGDADTETGAYTMSDGFPYHRNPGASWFLPNVDEWYKSAYYKSGGLDAGYWNYPTQSDSPPSNDLISPDPGNNANCQGAPYVYTIGSPYYRTNVGEFENSESAYGTYDQGGNVWEWSGSCSGTQPGTFGGAYDSGVINARASNSIGYPNVAGNGQRTEGFRVAAAVPEPTSLLILTAGLVPILALRRRRP